MTPPKARKVLGTYRGAKPGIAPSVIVAKIEDSETDFDTSVEALIALFDGQVDQEVLEAMLAAGDERVKSEASSPATPRPATGTPPAAEALTTGFAQPERSALESLNTDAK